MEIMKIAYFRPEGISFTQTYADTYTQCAAAIYKMWVIETLNDGNETVFKFNLMDLYELDNC